MTRKATFLLAGIGCAALLTTAQTPAPAPMPSFTATTDNVATHDSIRINLLRWSTDAERDQLLAAWNLTARPERGGRGGRGAQAGDDGFGFTDPALEGVNPPAGGRGAGGRGGRGGAAPAA